LTERENGCERKRDGNWDETLFHNGMEAVTDTLDFMKEESR
jgi:hypothetical protein